MSNPRPRPEPVPSSTPQALDVMDGQVVAELFCRAAEANLDDPQREGSTVRLPEQGRLVMTGDLHDHLPNLQRILKLAGLDEGKDRHVILHEVIHGPNLINRCDTSVRMLARVAWLKVRYPDQVHVIQSNHELAQLLGSQISKQGVSLTEAFDDGVEYLYGDWAGEVKSGVERFLGSLPLAARTATGLFFAHSLPSPHHLFSFDPTVIDRLPTRADLEAHGPVHKMVWGRHHDQTVGKVLGEQWDVSLFVLGHQPAEMGFYTEGDNMLVLASNHNHGVALPIDLARKYGLDQLTQAIVPLGSVMLD